MTEKTQTGKPYRDLALWEPLRARAESHWETYLPEYYHQLQKDGTIEETLDNRVEMTISALKECRAAGVNPDQANEIALPNILLPAEELQQPATPKLTLEDLLTPSDLVAKWSAEANEDGADDA